MAQIIVIGNEKGGSGKTTTAMHLIVSLIRLGFSVATIDLDSRQQSLTRYLDNRKSSSLKYNIALDVPEHIVLQQSNKTLISDAEQEEKDLFVSHINRLYDDNDFIIIDTPGSNSHFSKLSHSYADMVITPINDSFVDLDLIGQIHVSEKDKIVPGVYSAMLWEQKMNKIARENKEISWVVIRNRLSFLDAKNKRSMDESINKLSKKFGFRIAPGFGDRVIFKELFLHGLTLHDAKKTDLVRMSNSLIAARHELQSFISSLNFPEVNKRIMDFKE